MASYLLAKSHKTIYLASLPYEARHLAPMKRPRRGLEGGATRRDRSYIQSLVRPQVPIAQAVRSPGPNSGWNHDVNTG